MIFNITPESSVFATGEDAFDSDSPDPDVLNVTGTLRAAGGGYGAWLHNMGAWTVNVEGGRITSTSLGIRLDDGITGVSTISIDATGIVESTGSASYGILTHSPVTIINAGLIQGGSGGVLLRGVGPHNITNTGTISGSTNSIHGEQNTTNDTVINFGTLDGQVSLFGGNDTVENSGLLMGGVALGEGANRLINTGRIEGKGIFWGGVGGGSGKDTIVNTGVMTGAVSLRDGTNSLTNSGTIGGDFGAGYYWGGNDNDAVFNSGTFADYVTSAMALIGLPTRLPAI